MTAPSLPAIHGGDGAKRPLTPGVLLCDTLPGSRVGVGKGGTEWVGQQHAEK
jgi:hypothetical protein